MYQSAPRSLVEHSLLHSSVGTHPSLGHLQGIIEVLIVRRQFRLLHLAQSIGELFRYTFNHGRVLLCRAITKVKIRNILRIERINPLADNKRLVQELYFPILFRIGVLISLCVNIALQVH